MKFPVLLLAAAAVALAGADCFWRDTGFSLAGDWTGADGDVLPPEVVYSSHGDAHCETEDVWVLSLGRGPEAGGTHYLRDPERVMAGRLLPGQASEDPFDGDAALPPDAVDSGYRNDDVELWLAPDQTAAYLVVEERVERWPRSRFDRQCD